MSGKIGEKFFCEECGVEQIRTLINQKMCLDCRARSRSKYMYEKNKEYRLKNFTGVHKIETHKPKYSLAEVNAAARKHNMSYGQYVAAWKQNRVDAPEHIEIKEKKTRGRKCKGT